jgi:hypothetical protein
VSLDEFHLVSIGEITDLQDNYSRPLIWCTGQAKGSFGDAIVERESVLRRKIHQRDKLLFHYGRRMHGMPLMGRLVGGRARMDFVTARSLYQWFHAQSSKKRIRRGMRQINPDVKVTVFQKSSLFSIETSVA